VAISVLVFPENNSVKKSAPAWFFSVACSKAFSLAQLLTTSCNKVPKELVYKIFPSV
jgi:hypothetical protein